MTDRNRALATIGGGALIIIILWLLAHRSQAIVNNTTVSHPIELRPDYQDGPTFGGDNYNFGDINLGSIFLEAPGVQTGGCGCGCATPGGSFSSAVDALSNKYVQGLNDLQYQVAAAYEASIPAYVSQFFNNSQATAQSQAAAALFSNPYGG